MASQRPSQATAAAISLLVASLAAYTATLGQCQSNGAQTPAASTFGLASIPGGQTAAGIMASASDGMSRYLAPDGPIQPAITAIGGLPLRGAELANRGISSIASGLNSGAQSLSRSAGQNGQIRMPGMEAMESAMPASIASLGESLHGMIRQKNNFIRGQAERGVQAGERLRNMFTNGFAGMQVRSSQHMVGAGQMMGQAQEAMMKGGSELKSQLQGHLDGALGRLSSMQGMGSKIQDQMQGYGQTLSSGLQGAMGSLQQTGEKMMHQVRANHEQNMQGVGGLLGSMQGSMGQMGSNMQKNMEGLSRHAQSAASQLHSSLQSAVSGPLNMLQSLGSNLGSMMMKGGGGGGHGASSSSGSGRY